MFNKMKNQDKNNKIGEIDEHIRRNFDIIKRLGKGAYGIVWKAIDRRTQQTVAVKKIFDAFRNETDAQRTFREIMLLRALHSHPNIIQLYSIHRATNHMDIYLSFEFMESDLHNVIKRGTILKDIHKRYVMYQLLNATNFIHSGNIIHRDLKPSNILIDSKCRCKLADFGLARSLSPLYQAFNEVAEACLTDYVATRWYRAPEILIANKNYTKFIDMWSLGCILGEMCRGKPLFPGSCTINQIECVLSAIPEPTESDIKSVGNGFGSALLNQSLKPNNSMPSMDELLADSPNDAKQLVKALLVLDPNKRLTAKKALCHKYVEKFRNPSNELELTSDIVPPFRDDIQLSVSEYRSKLYEIMSIAEEKKHSTPSPSAIMKTKSSPTENYKKRSVTPSNGRTILPRTVTSIDNNNKKVQPRYPTEVNGYSSQKCQSDAKPHHSSYSSAYHSKTLNHTKSTSSIQQQLQHQQQHQQVHSKHVNGSRTRLTTQKQNFCKSCVQEANEQNGKKSNNANTVTMPKLKNEAKSQHHIDSSSSSQFEAEHLKHKLQSETKRPLLATTFRRNSLDANAFLQKSTFKRSFDDDYYSNETRRPSFDDGSVKETTNQQKYSRKISPPLFNTHPQHNDAAHYQRDRNGYVNGAGAGGDSHLFHKNSITTNDNSRLIKQMSLDEYTNATARLRKLEMKMRKHKIDILKYVNGKEQSNGSFGDPKKLLAYQAPNQYRTKLDPFLRTKSDCIYPKLNIDSVFQTKNSNTRKSTSSGSYGIISAADLHKLRTTTEHVT